MVALAARGGFIVQVNLLLGAIMHGLHRNYIYTGSSIHHTQLVLIQGVYRNVDLKSLNFSRFVSCSSLSFPDQHILVFGQLVGCSLM